MSPEEIVDGQLAAYNAGDLDAFLDHFVENVPVLSFPSGEELADRSGAAFRERFRAVFADSPGVTATLVTRVVKGNVVVDQENITSPASGEVRTVVAMYEVGPARIERMWFVA
ncbi:nuclear transport factor 2 family protein [Virgisporangium aurantiacum]|uniref:SnoaL-like domain-containing protein n=1 Tax=Virgisporangium aurantiacum TaxID=175570 RepID=A0A8J4E399_9ACTN|nr:nuclear transport factor 2 family protein [Virgisporangium aurantiacum]GIJ57792.1 hypothetical protein Vau01_053080 [Virgisporangium aurantiacum]